MISVTVSPEGEALFGSGLIFAGLVVAAVGLLASYLEHRRC